MPVGNARIQEDRDAQRELPGSRCGVGGCVTAPQAPGCGILSIRRRQLVWRRSPTISAAPPLGVASSTTGTQRAIAMSDTTHEMTVERLAACPRRPVRLEEILDPVELAKIRRDEEPIGLE